MNEMPVLQSDPLAERYRAAFDKTRQGREQWIEGTLELGEVVLQATKQYPDTNAFSRWLYRNGLQEITPAERTALRGLARDPVVGRKMLEGSRLTTWRGVWEKMPKRENGTPSESGRGTFSRGNRRSGHASGHRQRQRTQRIPDVMQDKPRPLDVVRIKGLTRQEVDPDFKGNAVEFATKYGHVNLHTKTELEESRRQDALQKELATIASLVRAAEAWLALPASEALPDWLEKPGKAARMRGWYEILTRAAERLRTDAVLEEKMKSWSKSANDDLGEIPF